MVVVFNLLTVNLFAVYTAPSVVDVAQNEGCNQTGIEHCGEGKLARTAVLYRQRALQGGCRRVVSRVVIACKEEQDNYHQHHADACCPNAFNVVLLQNRAYNAVKHKQYTHQKYNSQVPHIQKIVQILQRFHHDSAVCIYCIAVAEKRPAKKCNEENKE